MEDTCRGTECWFYILIKELIGKDTALCFDNCPFFVKSTWMPPAELGGSSNVPKEIKDCSCKRSLIVQLFDILPRLQGVQQSNEQMRNEFVDASNSAKAATEAVIHQEMLNRKLLSRNDPEYLIDIGTQIDE